MITKKILFTCMRNAMITSIIATGFTTVPTKAMLGHYMTKAILVPSMAALAGEIAFLAGLTSGTVSFVLKRDKQFMLDLQASKQLPNQQLITYATKIGPYAPLLILSSIPLNVGARISIFRALCRSTSINKR